MSEPAGPSRDERAAGPHDADAWSAACEEDLAAEKARRRAEYGPPPANAAEELRRLTDVVADRIAELGKPFAGSPTASMAQVMARRFLTRAHEAVEPVVARNPEVFDHLAAAGGELRDAYRAAVRGTGQQPSAAPDTDRDTGPGPAADGDDGGTGEAERGGSRPARAERPEQHGPGGPDTAAPGPDQDRAHGTGDERPDGPGPDAR